MASTNVGSIHYDLKLDTSAFDRAAAGVLDQTQKIGDKLSSAGKKMSVGLTLPIVAGFGAAVKAASDLAETINKVDVSFKDQAAGVKDWAKNSITSMGLAKQSALDAAALFGDMSTSMGLSTTEAAAMSKGLVQLGADLASFKNISFEQAQTALASVFTGETESLKRLGIVMTEANLEAFALSRGIHKSVQEMTQAEKVQLRYAYIMENTKNAQGDFARTSDSAANQIRIAKERFKELSAEVGAKLIPVASQLLEKLSGLFSWFQKLSPEQQKMILLALGVAAALGPVIYLLGNLVTAIRGVAKALMFLAANPVFLVITLAVLAIAGLAYLVIKNWDTIKQWMSSFGEFMGAVWSGIKSAVTGAWDTIYQAIKGFVDRIIGFFSGAYNWLIDRGRDIVRGLVAGIRGLAGNVWEGVKFVADKIGAFFSGAGRWLFDTGKAIIWGLIDGIKSMPGKVVEAAGNIASSIKNKFTSVLGIRSPSRVFIDYGENIVAGLVAGIDRSVGDAAMVVEKLNRGLTGGFNQPAPNINTSIYGNITIGNDADADRFLAALSRNQELAFRGVATRSGSLG